MAASLMVEFESGTWTGTTHSHNGYYAGDFSNRRDASEAAGHRKLPTAGQAPLSPRTGSQGLAFAVPSSRRR